jgi:hypothetical protein
MDEYDLDTTNLAGLDDHRDRLIALAEQCGQHDLAVNLSTPANPAEIPNLDEILASLSPLGIRKFFAYYDVVSRFRAHDVVFRVFEAFGEHFDRVVRARRRDARRSRLRN